MTELEEICDIVSRAESPLRISGGNSRVYPYDDLAEYPALSLSGYDGVIDYHPEELVVRVKSGTRIKTLVKLLEEQHQILGSEAPAHGEHSTIGGAVAAGLSGSRRPYTGSTRDFVLGVGMILASGEYAEFGGQVMKNVAGYDVARLVCGSFGVLGPITDISLKVLPKPEIERTLLQETSLQAATDLLTRLNRRVSGLTAAAYSDGLLRLRFSGQAKAVEREISHLGGDNDTHDFWHDLDSLRLPLFQGRDVWCLSTDPREPVSSGFSLLDWGFARRWLIDPEEDPRKDYRGSGHWTRVSSPSEIFPADVFHPVSEIQLQLMRSLKRTFDPSGIFNPGRLYKGV